MSTIHCSEQECIYQKDGVCYLNTVTAKTQRHPSSSCLYFCAADRENDAVLNLKNASQNPQK